MQITQCIQTLVAPAPSDGTSGPSSGDSALSEAGRTLKSVLESMPYYDEWRRFIDGPYASLIAVQSTVPIISEAKASDYLSSSNLAALPGSNFQQAMFGDRSPENGGFFDDDDDDDDEDDDGGALSGEAVGHAGRFLTDVVDFAQFDAQRAESSSNIFTFASFNDPGMFSPESDSRKTFEGDMGGIISLRDC